MTTEIRLIYVIIVSFSLGVPPPPKKKKHDTLNRCCLKFAHRLRRWTNIEPTLVQRIVFTEDAL